MTHVLAVRTDANGEIGAGHLMRCLALAQAWQDTGGRCTFLLRDTAEHFIERLRREAMDVVVLPDDAPSTVVKLADRLQSDWLALDGYRFDRNYQAELTTGPIRVLALDDNGETGRYAARLVLNQNGHAAPSLYRDKGPNVELLLGSAYTLLRREFRQAPLSSRSDHSIRRVLLTLGGGDHEAAMLVVVDAIIGTMGPQATCVVVTDRLELFTSPQIIVRHRVDNMATLMAEADFAVTAGGSTVFEAAALGLPALPLILADNQDRLAHKLAAEDGCFTPVRDLTFFADRFCQAVSDQAQQARIRERGPQVIDRQGAARVVSRMRAIGELHRSFSKRMGTPGA